MNDKLITALEEAIYEITHLSPRTCGPNEDSSKRRNHDRFTGSKV